MNITRTRVVLGAAAAGGLLLACNAILGIEEATPRLDGDASAPVNDVVSDDRANPGVDGAVDTGIDAPVATDAGDAGSLDASDAAVVDSGDASGPTITKIYAGTNGACAIFSNGVAKCWGRWAWGLGVAGDGGAGSFWSERPSHIFHSAERDVLAVTEIYGGGMCVLYGDRGIPSSRFVQCWGPNSRGQLGNGQTTDQFLPTDPVQEGPGLSLLGADELADTCVLRAGKALCWGRNDYGQAGLGSTNVRYAQPIRFSDGGTPQGLSDLQAMGDEARLARIDAGLVGWGHGDVADRPCPSQLCPTLEPVDASSPTFRSAVVTGWARSEVPPVPGTLSTAAISRHPVIWGASALTTTGVANWGTLTYASGLDQRQAIPPGTILSVAQTADADPQNGNTVLTRCFATTTGVFCRGNNLACQGGVTNDNNGGNIISWAKAVESNPVNALANAKQLVAGVGFFCALTQSNQVFCWGTNRALALGYNTDAGTRPVTVLAQPFPDAGIPYPSVCVARPVENLDAN